MLVPAPPIDLWTRNCCAPMVRKIFNYMTLTFRSSFVLSANHSPTDGDNNNNGNDDRGAFHPFRVARTYWGIPTVRETMAAIVSRINTVLLYEIRTSSQMDLGLSKRHTPLNTLVSSISIRSIVSGARVSLRACTPDSNTSRSPPSSST